MRYKVLGLMVDVMPVLIVVLLMPPQESPGEQVDWQTPGPQ